VLYLEGVGEDWESEGVCDKIMHEVGWRASAHNYFLEMVCALCMFDVEGRDRDLMS
jgi:hypothetical protein